MSNGRYQRWFLATSSSRSGSMLCISSAHTPESGVKVWLHWQVSYRFLLWVTNCRPSPSPSLACEWKIQILPLPDIVLVTSVCSQRERLLPNSDHFMTFIVPVQSTHLVRGSQRRKYSTTCSQESHGVWTLFIIPRLSTQMLDK